MSNSMTKDQLKTALIEFNALTTMQVAGQFSIEELNEIKDHLKAQREGILAQRSNPGLSGENEAAFNVALSNIKNMSKKANQAISMIQVHQAELKRNQPKQDPGFFRNFHDIAKSYLHPDVFADLKKKAANYGEIAKANGNHD